MKNRPECIPCCLRRVLYAANLATSDEWLVRKLLAESTQELGRVDELLTPAELVHDVSRRAARTLGVASPHASEKRRWLDEMLRNADLVRKTVEEAADPFLAALRLSVASNLFDCEFRDEIEPGFSLRKLLEEVDSIELAVDASEELRQAAAEAERIVFVHESAAEVLFDRLLIERFEKAPEQVISVVRDSPSLAGVLPEEAEEAGLHRVATLSDPGISCRGVPMSSVSQALRRQLAEADLVIAKGQAAYETLEGEGGEVDGKRLPIFFLLRVKCIVMARELGVPIGACVVDGM